MQTILLTGFEPFAGSARNPSAEIAAALDGRSIRGRRVVGAVLPCVFGQSRRELAQLLRRHRPELVVCVGYGADRIEVTPERVAINLDDARIADNAGNQPIDRPIVRGGATAYWSTLPVKSIVTALRRKRIPSSVSHTAGTFVCNHVFYALMHRLRRSRGAAAGFVHVPWPADWQPKGPAKISFATMLGAVETAIAVSLSR